MSPCPQGECGTTGPGRHAQRPGLSPGPSTWRAVQVRPCIRSSSSGRNKGRRVCTRDFNRRASLAQRVADEMCIAEFRDDLLRMVRPWRKQAQNAEPSAIGAAKV